MDYLPIFCQLQHKACLLVGGGEVAERKARLLLDAGAQLTVNSLEFSEQFLIWAEQGQVTLVESEFSADLLAEKWLVIAATDRVEVNALVYQCANQRQVFCNVVDDPKRASFIMPSIIDRSPIMVAVSSGAKPRCWHVCYGKNWKPFCRSTWVNWLSWRVHCASG